MVNNPYAQYRQTSIETASPAKLLLMLFDGAIKFLNQAIEEIDKQDVEGANRYLQKAQDIVNELMINLDMNIEISYNLYALYSYLYNRLIEANIKKDRTIAGEVLQFLEEFRETWAQAAVDPNSKAKTETGINVQG